MKKTQSPPFLKKNSKIAIISPAGAIKKGDLDTTISLLEKRGYQLQFGEHVYAKFDKGYSYAGTVEQRAKDLQWAIDGDFSAIWATRGGYGCVQLLEHLSAREMQKNPKWFIGYSDNTVLQSFFLHKGITSIHGQTIKTPKDGVSKESYDTILDVLENGKLGYEFVSDASNRKGKAAGILVGGNLAMIYSLMGSEFSFSFENKILFIEDIGENFYAIDRMLMNLKIAGVFDKIAGLIVGGMTLMGTEKDNQEYTEPYDSLCYELIKDKIQDHDFPVIFGFPNGHIYDNRALVIGANVEMEVSETSKLSFCL